VNLKLFDFPVGTPYKKVFTHSDDFKYASKKVSDLEKEIEERVEKPSFNKTQYSLHHYVCFDKYVFVLYGV
jgi:hypothetical protein